MPRTQPTDAQKAPTPPHTSSTPHKRTLWARVLDWNEFWGIPLAVILFALSPYVFRLYDNTAGEYDLSVLQALLFALVAFLFVKGVTWLLLRMDFPNLYKFLDDVLDNFYHSERHSRFASAIAVGIYALYLILFVVLACALL